MSSSSNSRSPLPRRELFSHFTYRELQLLARKHSIPCNLKKDLLRALINAKLEGRDEEVELLLKQDKEIKRRRKIQRDEERRTNYWNMQRDSNDKEEESQSEAAQMDDQTLTFQVRKVLKNMIDQSSCRNVTICKTQMEAHYRAYVNPVNPASSLDYTAGHSPPILNTGFYPTNTRPAIWQASPVNEEVTATTYVSPTHRTYASLCEIHKPPPANELVPYYPKWGSYGPNTSPLSIRNQSYCQPIKPAQPENLAISSGLDRHLLTRKTSVATARSETFKDAFQPSSSDGQSTITVDNPYHPILPRFGSVFKNNMARVSAACKSEFATQFQNDSADLVCLAETAACVAEQDGKEIKWPYKVQNHFCSTDNTDKDSYMTEGTSGIQDIPTWKNLLDSIPSYPTISCKFGCHIPMLSRDDQRIHETHCLLQPIQCPLPTCNWFSQLRSLSTHIFNVHTGNVVVGSESSFTINFGVDEVNSFYSTGSLGPKRLCYIQLFQQRLFAIFVIANFQSMQITIYTQYINDTALWDAKVALEVCKVDGIPYHWSGLVHPLTYSSMHLITRRKCLVFNMNSENFVNNIFTLHTKIFLFNLENSN